MRSIVSIKDNHITSSFNLEDGLYNITISKRCDDKTVEQVRKLWATIDDISIHLYGDKSESENIYLQILKMSGQRTTKVIVPMDSVKDLKKSVRYLTIIGKEVVNHTLMAIVEMCLVGISEMDKREVSQVIETTIRMASEYGVTTELC